MLIWAQTIYSCKHRARALSLYSSSPSASPASDCASIHRLPWKPSLCALCCTSPKQSHPSPTSITAPLCLQPRATISLHCRCISSTTVDPSSTMKNSMPPYFKLPRTMANPSFSALGFHLFCVPLLNADTHKEKERLVSFIN